MTGTTLLVVLLIAACAPASPPASTPKVKIATPEISPTITTVTQTAPPKTPTLAPPTMTATATERLAPFLLGEPGPFFPGRRQYVLEDPNGEGRKAIITVWYPAIKPIDYPGTVADNAEPDRSEAPYPLLLSSTTVGNVFAAHMASHGFIVAGVNGQSPSYQWWVWLTNYPREILFVLDRLASQPLEGLEGMLDAEHAGAMGYSFDGYNALALGGARVDPQYYQSQCAEASTLQLDVPNWWVDYICYLATRWENFAANAGEAITQNNDGLWQPLTDERIRAVMPMAPEGAWLFGERGLAAVNRPILIIGATEDEDCPYKEEAVYIYEHLVEPERAMITFVDQGHMMVFDAEPQRRMKHFAVAFFGYYLQGRADYAQYFSEAFVAQYPDLAWGVYRK